jgi:hypothetical protein
VGLATHLRTKHNITTDEYIKLHGEFRKNILKKVVDDTERCLICNDETLYNPVSLTWHLKKCHNLNKIEYVKQYILQNNIPTCKCGCGTPISIKPYKPYIVTEFATGHNSKGVNNPRYGVNVATTTRRKMQLKAQSRMEEYKLLGKTAPMHTPDAIATRAKLQSDAFVNRAELEYNVTILERNKIQTTVEWTVQCNNCYTTFTQYHSSYFTCWTCNVRHRSLKEQEMLDIFTSLGVQFVSNDRKILNNNKELDFYFPDHQLAIEFDGLYWHSELQGKDRTYHLQKTLECEVKGIRLLHIFEDEWEHHREIIIGKIKNLLKKDDRSLVYARNTELRELSSNESRNFLDTHHLQGADSAKYRLGLFYNNNLISVMTFSKPNASKGNIRSVTSNTYELSRYCTHENYRCVGGASKLLKYFIKNYQPSRIISYADRRYSTINQNVYETLGFTLLHASSPNYWYFSGKTGLKRFHRFNFTKKKTVQLGGSPDKTEWENMIDLGYNRIWDCGHLKYELIVK